jgi:hypothetical protein
MFLALDIKKDGVIDFEEYLCAVTVFRSGTLDDKAKCKFLSYSRSVSSDHFIRRHNIFAGVFLMYEGSKSGGNMSK